MVKRKKRKNIYGSSKFIPEETQAQMRAKFPVALVDAFVKICKADWENETLYRHYKLLEEAYMGKTEATDPIAQGKVIVQLARATLDMTKKPTKKLKCAKHKSYLAIRKPKVDCAACWDMYNDKKKAKEQKEKTKIT